MSSPNLKKKRHDRHYAHEKQQSLKRKSTDAIPVVAHHEPKKAMTSTNKSATESRLIAAYEEQLAQKERAAASARQSLTSNWLEDSARLNEQVLQMNGLLLEERAAKRLVLDENANLKQQLADAQRALASNKTSQVQELQSQIASKTQKQAQVEFPSSATVIPDVEYEQRINELIEQNQAFRRNHEASLESWAAVQNAVIQFLSCTLNLTDKELELLIAGLQDMEMHGLKPLEVLQNWKELVERSLEVHQS